MDPDSIYIPLTPGVSLETYTKSQPLKSIDPMANIFP